MSFEFIFELDNLLKYIIRQFDFRASLGAPQEGLHISEGSQEESVEISKVSRRQQRTVGLREVSKDQQSQEGSADDRSGQ